jgi:hypothetical protein
MRATKANGKQMVAIGLADNEEHRRRRREAGADYIGASLEGWKSWAYDLNLEPQRSELRRSEMKEIKAAQVTAEETQALIEAIGSKEAQTRGVELAQVEELVSQMTAEADQLGDQFVSRVLGEYLFGADVTRGVTQPSRIVVDWGKGMTVDSIREAIKRNPDVGITVRVAESAEGAALQNVLEAKRVKLGIQRSELRIMVGDLSYVVRYELSEMGATYNADNVSQFAPDTGTERFGDAIVSAVARTAVPEKLSVVSNEAIVIGGRRVTSRPVTLEELAITWQQAQKAEAERKRSA